MQHWPLFCFSHCLDRVLVIIYVFKQFIAHFFVPSPPLASITLRISFCMKCMTLKFERNSNGLLCFLYHHHFHFIFRFLLIIRVWVKSLNAISIPRLIVNSLGNFYFSLSLGMKWETTRCRKSHSWIEIYFSFFFALNDSWKKMKIYRNLSFCLVTWFPIQKRWYTIWRVFFLFCARV